MGDIEYKDIRVHDDFENKESFWEEARESVVVYMWVVGLRRSKCNRP